MSRASKLEKIYKTLPLISLVVLVICFIFRYSFIDFLGFDRPMKIAVAVCTIFGVIGLLAALLDGVNKGFGGKIFGLMVANILLVFSFPILITTEQFIQPYVNPYDNLIPETSYTTKDRDDAAFLLEGELYEWPISFGQFIEKGYDYREIEDNKISLSKMGASNYEIKPTWFTSAGKLNQLATESYKLELDLDGKGSIENQNVEKFKIRSRQDNWDFEVQGVTLLAGLYELEKQYGDKLIADPDNRNLTIKYYYVETPDGYLISYGCLQGKVQIVEIEKIK